MGKVTQTLKILANRAVGVKYGGVRFQGGKLQLVKTKRLLKFKLKLDKYYGEYQKVMDKKDFDEIMRLIKPLQKGANIKTDASNLRYLNAHGYIEIWDHATNKSIVSIWEQLDNPIRSWFKYGF